MKTTGGVGGAERGYELGGKKVKGRKRHVLVDTEGLVLKVKVHSAKVLDQEGIKPLLEGVKELFPRLSHFLWLDAGYRGEEKGREAGWRRRFCDGQWIFLSNVRANPPQRKF